MGLGLRRRVGEGGGGYGGDEEREEDGEEMWEAHCYWV